MRLGFYGDSFCAEVKSFGSATYLKKLKDHYNAEIVHTGLAGSSVGDVIMLQMPEHDRIPDICIFVWTDSPRLFNRQTRNINPASIDKHTGSIWDAAKQYYTYLHDDQFADIQYIALLEYFDNHVLSTMPVGTKIIHLWSFGNKWPTEKVKTPFAYRWKHGVEIRPALNDLADNEGPNHIASSENNELIFRWIRQAIDNYNTGDLLENGIFRKGC